MRRYIAETSFLDRGELRQVVTVYPATYNLQKVNEDLGRLTAKKGVIRKKNAQWRYKQL
ncbi:hypothetical protein 031MP004_68 [Bacillus phage 031MP004]|nr:hypothetical protein 022DV001_67 [Bacillus phage 022DV001]QFG05469.1 hypothetical protein 031MP003_70 [Bacillus phage 031MP003]QFG05558.1 hypothetical protein 031MP002_69 [Bacillus phage 031MP002]QFG05645.1 hypothetical protein 031MP004_68 [Bacillus phage 031MP004]QFG05817.1 hypothetical protein 055SW001_67 [Bacillus phage 055SW001]